MLSQQTIEYKSKKMKKRDNLDLARELRKLWNMKVTVVPLVIGVLRTVPKGLERGLEELKIGGRIKTIQTATVWRLARILRKVLGIRGDVQSLKLQ